MEPWAWLWWWNWPCLWLRATEQAVKDAPEIVRVVVNRWDP